MKKIGLFLAFLFFLLSNLSPNNYYQLIAKANINCDSLKIKITEIAKRHIKNDEGMKTDVILSIFEDYDSCFTYAEITDIYENEYSRLKEEKNTFWSKYGIHTVSVTAVLLFIYVIFKRIVDEFIKSLSKLISDYVLSHFSGMKIFYRASINRYRKALFEKYEKVHITFRPHRPLIMSEMFVPLKAIDIGNQNQLDVLELISSYRKSVIVGAPGSGKSMLCKNILFNFGNNILNTQEIPVLVELHRLNDSNATIENLLVYELTQKNFPNASNFITKSLRDGNLFILFDGYDEINTNERTRVTQLVQDFIERNNNCQFMITSRNAIYQNEFATQTDQTFQLVEFNHQQIRLFLNSWSKEMPEGKSINQLMLTLQDRPKIMTLAKNPLMLTIIAYLYTDTEHILPHSRGEFYELATKLLLSQWHEERNKFDARDKGLILQHLALINQDDTLEKSSDKKLISAKKIKEEIEKVLPTLNQDIKSFQDILNEIIERSGLLISVDGGKYFQFAHLTMQEFFAAKQLIDNCDGLFDRFKNDKANWRETLKLWCGLANDATKMISNIFEIDAIVAFECLADARKIEPEITDRIIEHFKNLLGQSNPDSTEMKRAFGIAASDVRPRGKKILAYLEDRLINASSNNEIESIVRALSYTYLPYAANIIGTKAIKMAKSSNGKEINKQIHNSLLLMGDIAIPVFCEFVNAGFINELSGLKQLGTPDAANALVNFIFQFDPSFNDYYNPYKVETSFANYIAKREKAASLASWYIADLLKQPSIEVSLRNYNLSPQQKRAPIYDWIWQPFNEPITSSLPQITGRVVYVLSNMITQIYPTDVELDKRIVVPLCINHSISVHDKFLDEYYINKIDSSVLSKEEKKEINTTWDTSKLAKLINIVEKNENIEDKYQFLKRFFKVSKSAKYIISKTQKDFAIRLLKCFCNKTKPLKEDWINILKPIDYLLIKGWHYKALLWLFAILNLSSLGYCISILYNSLPFNSFWIIFQGISAVIVSFNLIAYYFFDFHDTKFTEAWESFLLGGLLGFITIPILIFVETENAIKNIFLVLWMPFICYYNILFMAHFFNILEIIGIGLVLITLFVLFFIRGYRLERKSQNPLKGLLDSDKEPQKKKLSDLLFKLDDLKTREPK